jgi:hypothetical protein
MAINLILPVNELSVETCLEIAAEVENCPIATLDRIAGIARLVKGTFSPRMLAMASRIIPFNQIFNGTPVMLLGEEDAAVFYFFSNWRPESDPQRIAWPHISLRAATLIWPDIFNNHFQIHFQFPIRPESLLARLEIHGPQPPFESWIDLPRVPPRIGTLTDLASVRPRHAIVYILALGNHSLRFLGNTLNLVLAYIGLAANYRIEPVTPETSFNPGWDVTVLYMPADAEVAPPLGRLLQGILMCSMAPLLISARAALLIQHQYEERWEQMFVVGHRADLQESEVADEANWHDPSPTLLPRSQDLFTWITRRGIDRFLHSIPLTAGPHYKWRVQMAWRCGRVIAAAVIGCPIAIFNYDFAACWPEPTTDRTNQIENWVRFRHMALTTLSLMCEAMAGVPIAIRVPGQHGPMG